jgi:uncharacterized protein YndB with AHSA1/START domain
MDVDNELKSVQRDTAVGADQVCTVRLRREYDADVADVWDALINPERLPRWFVPVTGDFRVGGRYQVEGNAGGEILECEPPHRLRVSWVFGDDPGFSEVAVTLSTTDGGGTVFELLHSADVPPERWAEFGPGAVGVGWDLTLLGLSLHLGGGSLKDKGIDPAAWAVSDEGVRFALGSSAAWGGALEASGAEPEAVAVAVANTSRFYAPGA